MGIFIGDGQSVLRCRDRKKLYPSANRNNVIGVGAFHTLAHFLFVMIGGYWWCLLFDCHAKLGLEKLTAEKSRGVVSSKMKDLDGGNFEHAFTFVRVVTIAIYAFILQDVVSPPPELFLRNPDAYLRRCNAAGAEVLLRFLRNAGVPALQYQRAARTGRGETLLSLFAHTFHQMRTYHFKPNITAECVIGVISFVCTHPKLHPVMRAYMSVSLLGRVGRNMAMDRLLEYVNMLQQQRMVAFSGFDTALHFTEMLRAMIHVDHAYEDATRGASSSADPITKSMLLQARILQDHFKDQLGDNLSQENDANPFWYTGKETPMRDGDFRTRQPWLWADRVAEGRSKGTDRASSAFDGDGAWCSPPLVPATLRLRPVAAATSSTSIDAGSSRAGR